MKRGLNPIINTNSRVLILGTMPGDESLRLGRYYADSRNQLWLILSKVYGEKVGFDYQARVQFLMARNLALWDVLRAADRPGSLDSAIGDAVANDFDTLFREHPKLRTVAFNGQKAQQLFHRHVVRAGFCPTNSLRFGTLPSSSGTPGAYVLPLDDKIRLWKEFLTADMG